MTSLISRQVQEAKGLAGIIHRVGLQRFIIMCGSSNVQVMRHAPLVIGNIAQEDHHREGRPALRASLIRSPCGAFNDP